MPPPNGRGNGERARAPGLACRNDTFSGCKENGQDSIAFLQIRPEIAIFPGFGQFYRTVM